MSKKSTEKERKVQNPDSTRRKHGKARLIFKLLLIIMLLFISAGLIFFAKYFKISEWHRFDSTLITDAPESLRIFDAEGNELRVIKGSENRINIEIESLPEYVKYAFTSAEDARFYEHSGIDIVRIGGAALADLKAGSKVQGASTIGQQLIKLSHLSADKTFERKLEEAYLSICMEKEFTKDEILEMYMNYVYFGGGCYGIETAALTYFGVHASEISIAQAAQLAGIVKAPSRYAPHIDMEKSLGRRNVVLKLMLDYGRITEEEYASSVNEECVLKNAMPDMKNYYIDYAVEESLALLGISRNELYSGGYRLYIAIDTEMNGLAESLVSSSESYPKGSENAEGALVVVDNTGAIKAMAGGREYSEGCFNRAADMERQPGSLIKPIICYAPAMEYYSFTAADILDDSPKDFNGYCPRNSGESYRGLVTLRTALVHSLNTPAVEILNRIGVETGIAFARQLGISFDNESHNLALALGGFTHGVSPLEMAGAYAALARGGEYTDTYAVARIECKGTAVYEHVSSYSRVISEENTFILTDILCDAASTGTAKAFASTGLYIAAKTGTNLDASGNVRDAWTAAYTTDYTAVMWMGMDTALLGCLEEGTTGGNSAAVVLSELFAELYGDGGNDAFIAPDGVKQINIDSEALKDGKILLASDWTPKEQVISEYFTELTAPTAADPFWSYPEPPESVSWYPDTDGKPVITFISDDARYRYAVIRTDEYGSEFRLTEITGKVGNIEFRDASAMPGNTYYYTVRKIHPCLAENGKNLESGDSRRMRVIVWGYGGF